MGKRKVIFDLRLTIVDLRKVLGALILFATPLVFQAQSDTGRYVHPHLIRAHGTISPGYMTDGGYLQIYLHGAIEYYVDDRISLRGEGYYFLKSGSKYPWLQNHSVFSGASFHKMTRTHFDPYIGLQPGINISQLAFGGPCALNPCLVQDEGFTKLNPVISPLAGFNYYFEKVFHLFGEARYIWGRHIADAPTYSLSEFRFSFGLGINFN